MDTDGLVEEAVDDLETEDDDFAPEVLERLKRDVKAAAVDLKPAEVRYLVDSYYVIQGNRIRAKNQTDALTRSGEPHAVVEWLSSSSTSIERTLKVVLDVYTANRTIGRWSRSIVGIGPVLSAGLVAHVDISRSPTMGHLWSFAGLDPSRTWEKGQKRPWNARLKTLCWKIGESLIKTCHKPDSFYGPHYIERKAYEQQRSASGQCAQAAAEMLLEKKFKKGTVARTKYEAGVLPDAHIHARARRHVVKMFLGHWWEVAFEIETGKKPPRPYVIEHLGHVHRIPPPNWPMAE
jgi:hypothetical protein